MAYKKKTQLHCPTGHNHFFGSSERANAFNERFSTNFNKTSRKTVVI